ncbi:uncharacterized protein LACBIDRAFT_329836 [Laccaria bicolor S238N-H82]|uniref:Predicted protein n=1 Tax=Laccaria bicolor (strain S238N-H82 / ATCC MYA-4686) TaxID=486041 RepID=B0DJE0_LACBS|nr:uncharacterized protein LACBIDRAFT_329836 [Laccaria bicolor S238N-H82]EDR05387.1 predicted protein [Laccaria bicolor S238N-H82]|eukprot:XP_001883945.1 predicted protein [Laccaria bicolor S238N-H82]
MTLNETGHLDARKIHGEVKGSGDLVSVAGDCPSGCRIERNLGLTCDPTDGLVWHIPCIEGNRLGAVKAITAAQLSMASHGVYSALDKAIKAMRLTAADMSVKYKETNLSGLVSTAIAIPIGRQY